MNKGFHMDDFMEDIQEFLTWINTSKNTNAGKCMVNILWENNIYSKSSHTRMNMCDEDSFGKLFSPGLVWLEVCSTAT